MINRFSAAPIAADVQSTFVPTPIDFVAQQMQVRQNSYDKAKASINASQEAVYGVKGLSVDKQQLNEAVSGYDEFVSSEVEKVGGDYGKLNAIADQLGMRVKKDMRSGMLGAIHNNWASAQKHMTDLEEGYSKGEISKAGYNQGMASISGFGGTVEDGQGGYTKASFYTPAKYLELGKTADEYGKVVAEQYAASGEKFINADTAANHIYQNLKNNPQAVANAKEAVWMATNGMVDFNTKEGRKALNLELAKISKNAGNKIAFRQRFKPDEDGNADKLSGGLPITVDIIGAKPMDARMQVLGDDLGKVMKRYDQNAWLRKLEEYANSVGLALAGAHMGSAGGRNSAELSKELYEGSAESMANAQEESNRILSNAIVELSKDPMFLDMMQDANPNLDLSDEANHTPENFKKIQETVEYVNGLSANTRIHGVMNEGTKEMFDDAILNWTHFKNSDIKDMTTGEFLTRDEKAEMFEANILGRKDTKGNGDGTIEFAGEVMPISQNNPAQYYAPGSKVFGVYGNDNAYVWVPRNVNNEQFILSKQQLALTQGHSSWDDGNTTVHLQRVKDNSGTYLRQYIYKDGKMIARKNLHPNGQ